MLPPRLSTRPRSLRLLLLLAATLLATIVGPLAGATPVRRAAAQAAPQITIENLDKVPFPDRLVFQRINATTLPYHNVVILRIRNTGGGELRVDPLTISGPNAGSFSLPTAADRAAFTIPAGGRRDITVRFYTPDRDTDGIVRGQRDAILTIATNDPARPVTTVQLAGFNMPRPQGINEPNLQEIVDVFGYTTNITNPNEGQKLNSGPTTAGQCFVALGDEVISSNGRWSRADTSKGVYVRQLAALSGGQSTAAISISGTGGGSIGHGLNEYQTLLPMSNRTDANGNPTPAELTLGLRSDGTPAPGLVGFAVTVQNQSSLRCADDPNLRTAVRFWAARDRAGSIIPNTYIIGGDIVGNSATNYDYQDNVYLITNIRPANADEDPNRAGPDVGSPNLVLEFDRENYPGTLTDDGGRRTGFPETQRNRSDIGTILSGPGSSYDRTKLTLSTGGQGTLTLRTGTGSNENTLNTLVNGLCLPFDARDGRFSVSTRIVGPLTNLNAAQQQAGLMFGPNQGNYIKLSVGTQNVGQAGGQPTIQLAHEIDNVLAQVGGQLTLPDPAGISSLDLQLTGDPATGRVSAGYRINGGPFVALPETIGLNGRQFGRYFDQRAEGCLFGSSRGASSATVVFDRFAIEPAVNAAGGPTVSAGPDQYVRPGDTVTLAGSATDANGGQLAGSWQHVAGAPLVQLGGSGGTRTFVAPSSYRVLTFAFGATDGQGRSASDTVTVVVGDEPLRGLRITTESPVTVNAPTRLIASQAGGVTPISYRWDFGDGSAPVTAGPVVSHSYAAVGNYTVSVTASNAAGSASATAPVAVQPQVPNFAYRYDTGNTSDVTTSGVLWQSDRNLYTPSAPAERRQTNAPIANTEDDVLYHTYRGRTARDAEGDPLPFTYEIPLNSRLSLPAGTIIPTDVRLHFAEIYWGTANGSGGSGSNRRIFDVFVEGQLVVDNLDIFQAVGGAERALIIPIDDVHVTDGGLTLTFVAVKDYVAISAFEVLRSTNDGPANIAPVVSAGSDQTAPAGTQVALAATASDPDGDSVTVAWSQVDSGAPAVTLGGQGANRSFTAATPGSYVFRATATDSAGNSSSDTVVVNVAPAPVNAAPTADAGPNQTVALGAPVTLTGTASDPENGALTFSWIQVDNGAPLVSLTGSGATRSFTPPAAGSYLFTFTATDSGGLSASDSVQVDVVEPEPENRAPSASAGADQTVTLGATVTLSGTASDPDNDTLALSWEQIGGPAVTLAGSGATRTFTPAAAGAYLFAFTASDPGGLSAADTVAVNVVVGQPANQPPTANAGADQTVRAGRQVTLTGSGSDPENGALSYSWQQINGPAITLAGSGATRTFTPGEGGSYAFALLVSDEGGLSATDSVTVVVEPNLPPVANAGVDQTVEAGASVSLDGSASADPQGDPISYSWQQIGGPTVSLIGASGAAPSFTAPGQAATLLFRLDVADGDGGTASDTVQITVVNNQTPTASISAPGSARAGTTVTLDGSGSSDPEGGALSYSWQQIGGPAVTLSGASGPQASFTVPNQAGPLVFRLVVTDDVGITASAEAQITIITDPAPADGTKIFLPLLMR